MLGGQVAHELTCRNDIHMKRHIATLGLGLLLGGTALAAGESPTLKDQKDKPSYVIGYQYGANLLSQGVHVNPEAFLSGLKQAQEGKPSAVSSEETKAVHRGLQMQVMTYRHQQYLKQAEKNLEAGKAFLAEKAKKEGVKTLPDGLQYKVIKEGTGPVPKESDTVTVSYRGTLIEGTQFDSSYARGRPETIDVSAAIAGWKEALQRMRAGSKWELFVPTDLAYGQEEMGRIPPNSTLIFELELQSIGEASAPNAGGAGAPTKGAGAGQTK
jgi:FKBP-type peptidyl-prolyl cis-trans isomerase FklB